MAVLMTLSSAAASTPAERRHDAPAAQSRAIGVAYARCAVRQARSAVVRYLDEPFGTDDHAKLAKALPPDCLQEAVGAPIIGPSELHFPTLLSRGLLFEALYVHDFRKMSATPAFERAPSPTYEVAGVDPADQTGRRDYRALMRIGDCAVRAAPAKVRALLFTVAASKGEERAIADVHDTWLHCLPGHRELPFSVEMIRATVAEPLYRLTYALDGSAGRKS